MIYEIHITPKAISDLREINTYIKNELISPQSAERQLSRLEKAIYSLDQMPERFLLYETEPWKSRNLRIMPVDNYIVFYILNHEISRVTVIRIIYGGRDINKELKNTEFK